MSHSVALGIEALRLQELYCYGNQLTGTLPPELGRLTRLQILTVSAAAAGA